MEDSTEEIKQEKKDYYKNYKEYIQELSNLEKEIMDDLSNYKIQANNGGNTILEENKIREKLRNFKQKIDELKIVYNNQNAPVAFPANTLDRIQKEIQQYGINCGNMMKQFTNIYNNKYSHKDAINEDYSQKEEFKGIGTDELLYMQQKKLEGQDEQIAEITNDVKKNTVLAKNVGHVIKEQNVKLEEINEDIDVTERNMKSLTGRFKNYAGRQSWCCLGVILFIEFAIALGSYYLLVVD